VGVLLLVPGFPAALYSKLECKKISSREKEIPSNFPILFSRLFPMMMPKVISTMLQKEIKRIPMSEPMRKDADVDAAGGGKSDAPHDWPGGSSGYLAND
jgi:hypothetical protein